MRHLSCLVLVISTMSSLAQGPYSPQAGEAGSDAIHRDSALFRDWAISCDVQLGFRQVNLPDSGYPSSGTETYALGSPDAPLTISLGDGGMATLTFSGSFYNGEGPDFAIFENGFASGEHAFLELAFVEVSSDGFNFIRFPGFSLTDTLTQVGSFEDMDASYIHNLAGKYTVHHGVPFDLEELPDTSVLDKEHVTHVRIIDVVGTIDPAYGSRDSEGRIINDPWPTNFSQSGFDLDAVGIIHSNIPVGINSPSAQTVTRIVPFDLSGRYVGETGQGIEVVMDKNGNVIKRLPLVR